jgi:predicted glutamine amidotransferase
MCGIFGFVSPQIERPGEFNQFATRLFSEAQSRGTDASGFAAFTDGKNFLIDKRPFPAEFFTKLSKEWRNLRHARSVNLIGHTRAATSGDPKYNQNNHPFHGARYVVAHNGWVSAHRQVAEMNGIHLKTDCDSEVILHFLESKPTIRQGIIEAFNNLDDLAVMAVCVLDKTTGEVHLFRNSGSPCVVMQFKRWNATVFASTPRIIIDAAVNIVDKWGSISNHATLYYGNEMPIYSHVVIKPNGEVETTDLRSQLDIVKYKRSTPAHWLMDDYGYGDNDFSVFRGMSQASIDRLRQIAMADAKETSTPASSLEETANDGWSCAACDKPLAISQVSYPDPQNRSETRRYICETCYRKAAADKDPVGVSTDARRRVLHMILPASLITDGSAIDTICNWREPVLDHDMDDVDQATYIRVSEAPTERKIQMWEDMNYNKLLNLSDGEYLAYIDFIRNLQMQGS